MSEEDFSLNLCSLNNKKIRKNNPNPNKIVVNKKRKMEFEEGVNIKMKKIKTNEKKIDIEDKFNDDVNRKISSIQDAEISKDNKGNMFDSSNLMESVHNQIDWSNLSKVSKQNDSFLVKLSKEKFEEYKISKEKIEEFIKDIDYLKTYFYDWQLTIVYQKIVFYGLESYNNKLYENNSMFLQLSPFLISVNELPSGRYSQNTILLLKKTLSEIAIEKFLNKNLKKKNVINITGPSGIGKSFALISQILNIKNMTKDLVILHIILSNKYIRYLKMSLLNDIIFALSIFSEDKEFPKFNFPAKDFKETENSLRDWYFSIVRETSSVESIKILVKLLEKSYQYIISKDKKFLIILDQKNIYDKLQEKKNLEPECSNLLLSLINGKYCDLMVISAFNNNENFNDINRENLIDEFLEINKNFNDTQANYYLKTQNNNISIEEIEEIKKFTGNNPLELYLFSQTGVGSNFYFRRKKENYINNRYDSLFLQIDNFYNEKSKNLNWQKTFLLDFYVKIDSNSQISPNWNSYIDKRFMYVEERCLKSLSPISKKVIDSFYFKKYSEMQFKEEINFVKNYYAIYQNNKDGPFGGHLFEKIILSKFLQNLDKKITIDLNYYEFKKKNKKLNFSKKKTKKIELNNKIYFNDFKNDENFDDNYLFIPSHPNNPYTDLLFFDSKENILYAIQITINLIAHSNSDNGFLLMIKNNLEFLINFKSIQFIWITTKEKNIKEDILEDFEIENELKNTPKDIKSWIVFADEDNSGIWI